MVEFTLIAITFLFVILGVIQLAMVLNAATLVQYAAYNAARAGSVHGGDLEKMTEAARVSLLAVFPRHGRADQVRGMTENYLASLATDQEPFDYTYFHTPITTVKILNNQNLPCGTVVTFDDPKTADKAYLTVQVVHQYQLVIPLVNRMLFWVYERFKLGEGYTGHSLDYISKETDKMRRVSGQYKEIEYRIPLVAHYTIRLQSDYASAACAPPPPPPPPPPAPPPPTTTTTTLPPCGVFNNPTLGGLPVDHCMFYAVQCGQPPADLFCQFKGCSHATAFTDGPPVWETYITGDGTKCDGHPYGYKFCVGFSSITCAP